VLESRVTDAGDATRRRRECQTCDWRFTTYERAEQAVLWVTKHGGGEEPFDRAKLLAGLARACSKRNVPGERLEAAVADIEHQLRQEYPARVSSDAIGELALAQLAEVDDIAYVRFASVYRAFTDIDELRSEIDRVTAVAGAT
jgi:transcriptional repressor NrdR